MKYKITNFYDKLIKIDKLLLIAVYFLTFISCVFVYSATRSLRYLQMNILWILVGSVFMLFFTFVNYKIFKNYILHIYILSILMLLYVRFFGRTILGAKKMGFNIWLFISTIRNCKNSYCNYSIIYNNYKVQKRN